MMGIVCLGRFGSPEGWAMDMRFALSDLYWDLEALLGFLSTGFSSSASLMSSGVNGLRRRNFFMLREPSWLRYARSVRASSGGPLVKEVGISLIEI